MPAQVKSFVEHLKGNAHPFADVAEKFVSMMDNFVEGPSASSVAPPCPTVSSTPDEATSAACTESAQSEDEICEQQLLEAVMRESLSADEDGKDNSSAEEAKSIGIVTLTDATSCLSQSALLASMTGPSMRFVADVTFPDSSSVLPGSVLNKVWRIKNDGVVAWPAGVCLVASGGDDLSESGHRFVVPTPVNPGEEVEAGVVLTAPRNGGRYVAYFRLTTPHGCSFGQRLWADITVAEEEDHGWDVVGDSVSSTGTFVASAKDSENVPLVPVILPAPSDVIVEDVDVEDDAIEAVPIVSQHIAAHESKYGRELFALREMGFSDLNIVIPLLQRHIPDPETMSDATRVDCLQHVIISLLSQSGAFNF